jgi:hypothetical protein
MADLGGFWTGWLLKFNKAVSEDRDGDAQIQGMMAVAHIGQTLDDILEELRK